MTKKEKTKFVKDNTTYVKIDSVVKKNGKEITFRESSFNQKFRWTFNGEIAKTYKLKNKIIAYDVYIY